MVSFWLKYSFEGFSDETFVKFWSNFLNLSESRIKSNLHANEPEAEQIFFEWCVKHRVGKGFFQSIKV